jgi:hypothetical protein
MQAASSVEESDGSALGVFSKDDGGFRGLLGDGALTRVVVQVLVKGEVQQDVSIAHCGLL